MPRNRMVVIVIAIIVSVVGGLVFQPWQYFVTNEVDEAFPEFTSEERQAFDGMPEDSQETFIGMSKENPEMALETFRARQEVPVEVPEDEQAMPPDMPDEPTILSTGSFIQIDPVHGAEGNATIYGLPDGNHVIRFEEFQSTNGPDLHVFLSKENPTSTLASIGDDAIDLGALKGNVGNQNYEIPADVDLSEYRSVVIYCVPFHVVFSSAELG